MVRDNGKAINEQALRERLRRLVMGWNPDDDEGMIRNQVEDIMSCLQDCETDPEV